ncbi:MAG: Hsp20/alpha crystallin family protein [Candidatus Sungbacteria bacterium]|uniref:Hsp20/alpha crystallin family protein n=1 Tax=Candidatus Sungiibacteriota bacterium TaxID=2750080 RepID=A0A9D6QTV2_9BACT|nr:Hsp20/alpha crystallin family protein [Candidatus Sungbacteria bacterium]
MAKSFFERLTGSKPAPTPSEPPRERISQTTKKIAEAAKPELEAAPEGEAETVEEGELSVDIFDDGDYVTVQAIVGGVKPEDLDVQVTDEMVTIRGKRSRTNEVREENFFYQELYWGSFVRSIILPQEIISDEAEASMKNGLLTVKLPKRDRNKAQKLRVKSD